MDLKKNKFLSTYLIVLVVGLLALGYFYWTSLSAHTAAKTEFENAKSKVSTLEGRPVFPSQDNVEKRRAQVSDYAAKADELQKQLLTLQKPLETDLANDRFQTKLNESIRLLKQTAEATKLGSQNAEFDLGFGKYLNSLPPKEAVADLNFSLDGIQAAVNTMLTDRVTAIESIERGELAVESGKPAPAEEPTTPAAKKAAAKKGPAAPAPVIDESTVVQRYPFTVRFSGSAASVEAVLNHLASSKEQFWSVRQVRIENEKKSGAAKGSAPTESSDPTEQRDSRVVLGGEKVSVVVWLELVRFLEPKVAADDASTTKKPS